MVRLRICISRIIGLGFCFLGELLFSDLNRQICIFKTKNKNPPPHAQNNLKASRTRAEITDETINEAIDSVDNKFKEGLAQRTTQILKLKEEIRQQDIILKKAEAKLLYIKENRVKPGDESTEEE